MGTGAVSWLVSVFLAAAVAFANGPPAGPAGQHAADTVAIEAATWTRKTSTLLVLAKSSASPAAKLTVVGFGAMTYNSKTKLYAYEKKTTPAPGVVTVSSNLGGAASLGVTQK
jgi:hypothetical protein